MYMYVNTFIAWWRSCTRNWCAHEGKSVCVYVCVCVCVYLSLSLSVIYMYAYIYLSPPDARLQGMDGLIYTTFCRCEHALIASASVCIHKERVYVWFWRQTERQHYTPGVFECSKVSLALFCFGNLPVLQVVGGAIRSSLLQEAYNSKNQHNWFLIFITEDLVQNLALS